MYANRRSRRLSIVTLVRQISSRRRVPAGLSEQSERLVTAAELNALRLAR